jgi:hypothetical protein
MHVLDQTRLRSRRVQLDLGLVVDRQRVRNRAWTLDRHQLLDRLAGFRQPLGLTLGEGRGAGLAGPERRVVTGGGLGRAERARRDGSDADDDYGEKRGQQVVGFGFHGSS